MTTLTLKLDKKLSDDLKRRADKNYQTVEELSEDIIRRSMRSYRDSPTKNISGKADDPLINIFSRFKVGRKKKEKK